MSKAIWILGAPDPEMEAIERLLRDAGETVVHGMTGTEGSRPEPARRVRPGERVTSLSEGVLLAGADAVVVECRPDTMSGATSAWLLAGADAVVVECRLAPMLDHDPARLRVVDHHAPGDPGYGRPPAEFLPASSLGQVVSIVAASTGYFPAGAYCGSPDPDPGPGLLTMEADGRWLVSDGAEWAVIPTDLLLVAAADHCLGAAYRGECPGVEPGALMRWRAESRAAFQRRSVEEVLADVEATTSALRAARTLDLQDGVFVANMRREPPYPELPEAAARAGVAYISGPLRGPDGRAKITCSGPPEVVAAFLRPESLARLGLEDPYGDPARGFAGGYLREVRS